MMHQKGCHFLFQILTKMRPKYKGNGHIFRVNFDLAKTFYPMQFFQFRFPTFFMFFPLTPIWTILLPILGHSMMAIMAIIMVISYSDVVE